MQIPGATRTDMDQLEASLREGIRLLERSIAAEQQLSDQANLLVAVNTLHGAADAEGVVTAVREIVANLVGCEEFALFEIEPGGQAISLIAVSGVDEAPLFGLQMGRGIIGAVASTGKPFVRRAGGAGDPGSDESITACLPLRIHSSVVGVLAIFRLLPHKAAVEDNDLALFDVLSTHVASALVLARLHRESRP